MIKAVIFDMFETLVSFYKSKLYKGTQIALDIGIPIDEFRKKWDASEYERAIGLRTFEDVIAEILDTQKVNNKELYEKIIEKRYRYTFEAFKNIHPDIIPMMKGLKNKGVKIGLITNCYYEERDTIIKSDIFSYFDAAFMSCEIGMTKPDTRIYLMCAEKLGTKLEECLYVGDGGNNELAAALAVGMKPVQALWYLKEGSGQPCGKLDCFNHAALPTDILNMI